MHFLFPHFAHLHLHTQLHTQHTLLHLLTWHPRFALLPFSPFVHLSMAIIAGDSGSVYFFRVINKVSKYPFKISLTTDLSGTMPACP